ncbi:MAG: hypothetical protein AAF962_19485 [Actinomycetota bacterium]
MAPMVVGPSDEGPVGPAAVDGTDGDLTRPGAGPTLPEADNP